MFVSVVSPALQKVLDCKFVAFNWKGDIECLIPFGSIYTFIYDSYIYLSTNTLYRYL